jgi:uncharacterized membrane protein YvbJ
MSVQHGKNQAAKFFCEYCGAEVPQHAKLCKKCGRFFSSVRCPMCGKSGNASVFTNGCPYCGYAVGKRQPAPEIAAVSAKTRREDPLPTWLYLLCAGVFIGLVSAFIFALYR